MGITDKKGSTGSNFEAVKTLSEIGTEITSSLSIESVIEKVYENVNKLMPAEGLDLGIYDEKTEELIFKGTIENGSKLEPHKYHVEREKERLSARCFNSQKEIYTNNLLKDFSDYPEPKTGLQPSSVICLPLIRNNYVIGIFSVYSFFENAYSEYHLFLLRNLSIFVSVAIENAKTYAQLENKSRENEVLYQLSRNLIESTELDVLLENLLKDAVELVPDAQFGTLLLLNDEGTMLEGQVSQSIPKEKIKNIKFKVGEGVSGKAVAEGRSLIENHVHNAVEVQEQLSLNDILIPKSILAVLLKLNQKTIGVISVDNYEKDDAFNQNDIRVLESLAANAAVAIERVQLTDELKVMNEELKAYDRMVSHDLKGPIGNIHSCAELLLEYHGKEMASDVKLLVDTILKSSKGSLELIQDILAYASAEKHESMEDKVNLNALMEKVIEGHASTLRSKNAVVEVEELPVIKKGISVKLHQLFYNLIGNALKFQADGSIPNVRVFINDGGEITVEDNGIGFKQSEADDIFRPLQRLDKSYEGHGIGLATCKRIVDLHGWKIRAESSLGRGTRFIITIS